MSTEVDAMPSVLSNESKIISTTDIIFPSLLILLQLYHNHRLKDYDLVGCYILMNLAIERPNHWLSGQMKQPISSLFSSSSSSFSSLLADSHSNQRDINSLSFPLKDLSLGILNILGIDYLNKKFANIQRRNERGVFPTMKSSHDSLCDKKMENIYQHYSIVDIFSLFQFHGIKKNTDNYINVSIVQWCLGNRPFELLFHIPSPMQVLRQQALGKRVVTLFTKYDELVETHVAMLYYMNDNEQHAKSSFEFTLHDLKHMELFYDNKIYDEQVGFFRCFFTMGDPQIIDQLNIIYQSLDFDENIMYSDKIDYLELSKTVISSSHFCNLIQKLVEIVNEVQKQFLFASDNRCRVEIQSKPRDVFTRVLGLDDHLWYELEYVISDMNCYSTHLIRYLYAKLIIALEKNHSMDNKIACINEVTIQYRSWKAWITVLLGLGMCPTDSHSVGKGDGDDLIMTMTQKKEAFFAGISMLNTTFHKVGPMNEVQGEVLRNYFQQFGKK